MTKEELEKEAEEYSQKTCGYIRVEIVQAFLASAEPREKRIAELEKENAELKKKNLDTQDAVTMQMYTNKANKEIADRQFTKAKEIIREFMKYEINEYDGSLEIHFEELKKQAEQFLSEVEK
jgi:hypothetical protein